METIEPFSSCIIPVKAGWAYTGECINIMVQALQTEDGFLPQDLTVQNTYTKLRKGSKKSSHGGKEQHSLLTDPPEENPSGQSSSSVACAPTPWKSPVAGGGWWAPEFPYPQTDC